MYVSVLHSFTFFGRISLLHGVAVIDISMYLPRNASRNLLLFKVSIFGCSLKMAFELYGILAGNISPMTGENVKPAYGGENEAFLHKVVTPIYQVIAKVFVTLIHSFIFMLVLIEMFSKAFIISIISSFFDFPGSCKEQTREIKTFPVEEL